jgi:hypothetical protein
MIVSTITGEIVNIDIDFSRNFGAVDKNGHTVFTSEKQIEDFINGIEYIDLGPDMLIVEANDLLLTGIESAKGKEFMDITTILL